MLVSADAGKSWALEGGFPARKVRCLLALGGTLYADADGVFASSDEGQNWSCLSTGLPADGQVFALSAVEGKLFAGLYSRGLYAWDEEKHSWAKIGRLRPLTLTTVQGKLIAGHNPGGLYWSEDFGATASKGVAAVNAVSPIPSVVSQDSGELSPEAPVWELASNDSLVFAGASAGIYYSQDHGQTWVRARIGLPDENPGIAFLPKEKFVLAATQVKRSDR